MEQAYLPGTIRERIQDLIKERKLTQAQLAAEIDLSEAALSRFLSGVTDKLGNDYITRIANYLDVSTDFLHGLSDFPERYNYDIGELGLSHKAALALYTGAVNTEVVNRLLENVRFHEITKKIGQYFNETEAAGFAGMNAMVAAVSGFAQSQARDNPVGAEAAVRQLEGMTVPYQELEVQRITDELIALLCEIKAGIQTKAPISEALTKQAVQGILAETEKNKANRPMTKDELTAYLIEQSGKATSGVDPALGRQIMERLVDTVQDLSALMQQSGMTNEETDK
ncbi:MAG: helix-turn-helix domain-containing protein [Christensenellales bacterium]|jgi:transcriptional regulator with XRE-family HTH domain